MSSSTAKLLLESQNNARPSISGGGMVSHKIHDTLSVLQEQRFPATDLVYLATITPLQI